MKILLINHYAGSKIHGMEFRPFYLAREWTRVGHKVLVLAASQSHIRARAPAVDGSHSDEEIEGVSYRWYATPSYAHNGIRRVWNMLTFMLALWRNAKKLTDHFKPDVVIASSTYPMDIWPARRIANFADAKLIFEVHDLWPLSPIELGGMPKWHPFIAWVQMAEDYAYRNADMVVSMLPKALPYMQSRGLLAEKFVHVPNGIDEGEWGCLSALPAQVVAHLDQLKATGLPIVGYAGTHGLANALDVLLDSASELRGHAHIVLMGLGPERERLIARVKNEGLGNVSMLPAVPKQAVPSFLAAIDIAYIGWLRNPLYRFGISPNKLMDYMMAAKPIVHSVDAGNDPVAEARCGVTVPPEDPTAVARAIRRLIAMSASERQALGSSGRTYVLSNHTYRVLAQKFLSAIA